MPDDPLDKFIFSPKFEIPAEKMVKYQAEIIEKLDRLTMWLEKPNPKKNMADQTEMWSLLFLIPPIPNDLERAQKLWRKVVETGGSGSTDVEETLLNLIAVTASIESIPFWLEALNLSYTKDRFRKKRQRLSLAALASLAIKYDQPLAYDSLRQAMRHDKQDVRALAIHYLGRAYFDGWYFDNKEALMPLLSIRERHDSEETFLSRPIPPEVLNHMANLARKDKAFTVRFEARQFLRFAQQPMPIDYPGGVYVFKVKFMSEPSVSRTIELRAEQSLENLHYEIQRAIEWDADHLYSFFMNNKLHDNDYAFASPRASDSPPWADQAIVGDLGLSKKDKFLYFFDYGDSHKFEIQVIDIRSEADEEEKYPRLVESEGEAPPQYPNQDEENEDEDEGWW